MKSHPSIFRCEFAPGHRTLKHPFVLTRKKLVAVAVFLSVAGLLGGAQGSPASRIEDLTKEVAAVRPLACDAGNPRGNSTYKTALVGAVIDLRAAIQSRIDEIQKNVGITEDERQSILVKYKAIVSSIDAAVPPASAADITKAILNVCAFLPADTMPGTP